MRAFMVKLAVGKEFRIVSNQLNKNILTSFSNDDVVQVR